MSNPHIKNADNLMTVSGSVSPGGKPEARLLAAAQIEATLALAYEQRTANLLAFFAAEDIADTSTHCIDYRAVADQIEERLGLA